MKKYQMKAISKNKLDKFRSILLQQRQELSSRDNSLFINEHANECSDEADIAQNLVINDMCDKFSQREKETIQKINKAIRRIDDEIFGICEACEEMIPEKRLEAMPLCILCVSCAEWKEKQEKQYRK